MAAFCAYEEEGKWLEHKFKEGVVEVRSFVVLLQFIFTCFIGSVLGRTRPYLPERL